MSFEYYPDDSKRRYLYFGASLRYFLTLFLILALSPVAAGEKVVLQLKWEHEFQFAGYYAALWQGYYSAEGLDVEIKPASTPEGKLLNPVEAVTSGRAHFAIGEMDILLAKDAGHDLVILAPIFQRNPVSIFALQSTQMGNVRELAKLRIAAPKDNDTRAQVKVLFRTQGIDPDAVAFVDVAPNVTSLQAGLAAHIAINPSISQEEFERYASAVFQRETHLINVGAAPNLVVTMIYPLETNRGALGLDYRSNEAQREAVLEVKNSGEMIVAGPVNLVQGGLPSSVELPYIPATGVSKSLSGESYPHPSRFRIFISPSAYSTRIYPLKSLFVATMDWATG